ncbi:fungal Rad9-like Rad53-binding-domain-containing protein [Aspergillus spinulosporus]
MGSAETIPSDTQVISQSVYDEIIRKNKEAGNEGSDSNVLDRNTLMTLQEGGSGNLDLLSGFDVAQLQAPNTDDNDDQNSSKLGESSPLSYERNHFPESQRFLAKTPLATKQGQIETDSTVSPLVSRNPLASDLESASGVMALSQVFKATQAPSSPLVNGIQSDLLSDRPSPNIPIQNRPLAPSLSSPFNNIAATFPRDSSDTQLNYVALKDSQTSRNDMARGRMTRSADHTYSNDYSDGGFGKGPIYIERMKREGRIDEGDEIRFSMIEASARPFSDIEARKGRQAISSSRESKRCDMDEDPTAAVQLEQEGISSDLQAVGTSEEETEQEEELLRPTPQSQVPHPSAEEDKENCDDPPVIISHTGSAHNRLSQALSLHESLTGTHRMSAQTVSGRHSPARNEDLNPGTVDVVRSSPISVVKDSQWSPERDDVKQAEPTIVESPGNQGQTHFRDPRWQSVAAAGHGRGILTPADQPLAQELQVCSQNCPSAISLRPEIADFVRTSKPSLEGSGSPYANLVRMRKATDESENGDMTLTFGAREKSSSMPSCVAETPVHSRQRTSNDLPRFATIPETSPTRLDNGAWTSDGDNEAADQEDDDLPLPYPKVIEDANKSRPFISQSSSPVKRLLNSKILSSPSGRQRRALTEIAADASPQVGANAIDVNIDIMSAEDYEFRDAIAQSPIPPRKKRRGNDGRNIPASDPIIPVTPRAETHPPPLREEEETILALPSQPTNPRNQRQSTSLRRPKPSRRAGSIWDTEDSPKFRLSSKERSKLFARSQARERQPPPVLKPELEETPQPIPVPSRAPVEISSTPVPEAPSSNMVVEEITDHIGQRPYPENSILVPNQVLAPWRGQKRAYYPAVCLGTPFGTSQDQYMVKFEDSAPVEVPKGAVKRLELRIGDAVKVDMPHIPKITHIIRGFAHKLSAEDAVNAVTDIYGHATLVVGPKQRKNLPNGGLSGPEDVINVPVSRIYLDTILWNKIRDRPYTYNPGSEGSGSKLQTPPDRHIAQTSPSTRLSRNLRPSDGLFSGMVFAVSYGDKSEAKYRVTKMILENNGRILEDGFNELFELPLNAPVATPTGATASQPTGLDSHLRLKPDVEDAGFACLIADKHSRRPKYMQALALNIPCLSDRWVEDCVAKGQIMDWEMYLLPAGESSYLNGATKSRILTPYPATRARLSKTISSRPNLLNGQSVLLITGRNGKVDEERRKAYIFLTYALGASKIERVPDIQSARTALQKQLQDGQETSWNWVYIDDDDKAAKVLAAGSLPSKRRKNSRLTEPISGDDLGLNSNVRVVGNEFVCQSLILGRLVDQ